MLTAKREIVSIEAMIIGHEAILDDLKKLADREALAQSYLFFGPTMVGKKTIAHVFAEYLEKGEAIGKAVLSDSMTIEPGEGGSIGIDAVREIKNFLWQKPNISTRRTLIINDAELLTAEAQNALLKITEEPPVSSLLIMISADIESLMPTILSRFQKIYFGLVSEKEIAKIVPLAFAKKAMGKPGLAWHLANDTDFRATIELAEKFLKSAATTRRDLIKKIIEPEDFDLRKFLDAVIMVLAWNMQQGIMENVTRNNGREEKTELWHKALSLYDRQTNFSLNPRLQLENLLFLR